MGAGASEPTSSPRLNLSRESFRCQACDVRSFKTTDDAIAVKTDVFRNRSRFSTCAASNTTSSTASQPFEAHLSPGVLLTPNSALARLRIRAFLRGLHLRGSQSEVSHAHDKLPYLQAGRANTKSQVRPDKDPGVTHMAESSPSYPRPVPELPIRLRPTGSTHLNNSAITFAYMQRTSPAAHDTWIASLTYLPLLETCLI